MEAIPLAAVLARPDIWRGDRFADAALPALASGFADLDSELPGGGWPRGALTELLSDGAGQGELALLLPALRQLSLEGGWVVLVAPPYPLHAGAWAAAGIALERLLVVTPAGVQDKQYAVRQDHAGIKTKRAHLDALWTAEQALASDAPSAVLCWSMQAENKAVRRLQLAAATSHAAGFLFRPLRAATESSAAVLRLALTATDGGIAVDILKRRGPPLAQPLQLTLARPAKWRAPNTAHGNPLARPASAATVARHPSGPLIVR